MSSISTTARGVLKHIISFTYFYDEGAHDGETVHYLQEMGKSMACSAGQRVPIDEHPRRTELGAQHLATQHRSKTGYEPEQSNWTMSAVFTIKTIQLITVVYVKNM